MIKIEVIDSLETGELGRVEDLRAPVNVPVGYISLGGRREFLVIKHETEFTIVFAPPRRELYFSDIHGMLNHHSIPNLAWDYRGPSLDKNKPTMLDLALKLWPGQPAGAGLATFVVYPANAAGRQSRQAILETSSELFHLNTEFDPLLLTKIARKQLAELLHMSIVIHWSAYTMHFSPS